MIVKMKTQIGGYRNEQPWPPAGGMIELPDHEAADMIANGYAEEATGEDAPRDDEPVDAVDDEPAGADDDESDAPAGEDEAPADAPVTEEAPAPDDKPAARRGGRAR